MLLHLNKIEDWDWGLGLGILGIFIIFKFNFSKFKLIGIIIMKDFNYYYN
jgi:hypothetical protein